ncbi:MAG: hypothetical protein WC250_00425 [Candidatus Paceibacterota bacterium]|jgi:Tfp pilus assembly protein PilO
MKPKNTTTKTLLALAVCLALGGLVGYYFYFNHIKGDGEAASSLQNEIDLLAEKATRLDSIKSILADTSSDRAKLAKAVVAADGVANFASELEALGVSLGTTVAIGSLDVKSLSGLGSDTLEILAVRLSASGSWRQVTRLFSALENLPYGLRFEQVSLNKSVDSKTGVSWQVAFSLEVLKRK